MRDVDFDLLVRDLESAATAGVRSIGILGLTPVTLRLLAFLTDAALLRYVSGVYVEGVPPAGTQSLVVPIRTMASLREACDDVLIVAVDDEKEDLLTAALPHVEGAPKVIVSGYGHLRFQDRRYREAIARLLVPSLANGYPNSLIHLFQCLVNAARLNLQGVVAEFGMFKGGTTMFLSVVAELLGKDWRVIGFDTFGGFPAPRSMLDMYDHPDCVFTDVAMVKRYLEGRNVEVVAGDLVETQQRIAREDLVLSFVDTDNYTPAKAVLEIVRERTVLGGAIVFDHFTGTDRFRYTVGERMAGKVLLDDARYFHLHDTGVFYRQR